MECPPFRYRVLLTLLSPFLALTVFWQAWKVRSSRFLQQRLGFCYQVQKKSSLWIHCASVGEVNAALPLIRRLGIERPEQLIVVSTTTPTGADTVLRQNLPNVQHQYLPVDFKTSVKKVIVATQPAALILMETEIWPNLINEASRLQIPVVIVNARLSDRTLQAPSWIKPVYRQALSKVKMILAKSEFDACGFKELGAVSDQVTVVGNIKFAATVTDSDKSGCDITLPFWLAASTHEDEEEQICRAMIDAASGPGANNTSMSNTLLVVAPRHPNRSAGIQQMLSRLNISYAVRSLGQLTEPDTQVYLADQLGEMKMWFDHAQAAFMGGSLVPVGGHNLLEPALAGVPVICGPHLDNVHEEAQLLLDAKAMLRVSNVQELIEQVDNLLGQAKTRQSMGAAGRELVLQYSDVLEQYVNYLLPIITVEQ